MLWTSPQRILQATWSRRKPAFTRCFNAGRDRCAGALSWDPVWETADIADGSGGSYFFHAGIPGFGATFDDLDAMAQYCYNKRVYDGERDIWVLLLGYGEELPIDGINAAMTRVTNRHNGETRWRFWGWPTGGSAVHTAALGRFLNNYQ